MNRIMKGIGLLIILLFLSLYFSKYINYNHNTSVLTDAAIQQFEKDLKNGKKIIPSNYLPEEKNYNNRVCNIGRKASSLIEKSFNKLLRYSLRYLDDLNE
ncbi:MAG: hypothetical protein IKE63_05200 [Bacilli bacterium]|nr:hypothetical protein [Bacilli bacterium]